MSQESQSLLAPPGNTALAERPQVCTWTDPDWQRFWLTIEQLDWRTLAFVPAGEGAPADLALTLAVTLSRTGMSHVGSPILVADGTQVKLTELTGFLADVKSCADAGQRVIVALSSAAHNPTVPAIAKSVDGVILCVAMGQMKSADARATIRLIGAQHFKGSVIIHPDKPPK